MDGHRAGVVELEHGSVRRGGDGADGRLGQEERDEVSEGFWGQVSEEAVLHAAGDLVGVGVGLGGRAEEHDRSGLMSWMEPIQCDETCGARNNTWEYTSPGTGAARLV